MKIVLMRTELSIRSGSSHLQNNATAAATMTAAAIAPDSTCGSEFSDSGSSSVSDDVVMSGRRLVMGSRNHEMATLMEKDDGDEIGGCKLIIHFLTTDTNDSKV